jgi:uncharacterized integral membrane protein (TIGR02327 family)
MMSPIEEMERSMATTGLLSIAVVLVCISVSWWALQQFRFDLFVKSPGSAQAKLLQVLASIAIGYGTANFILDYFNWSLLLRGFF